MVSQDVFMTKKLLYYHKGEKSDKSQWTPVKKSFFFSRALFYTNLYLFATILDLTLWLDYQNQTGMLSGSFLCPNVPQVSHCPSLVQVSLLTKVFVIDLRVSATAGPPVNECPLWGDCPPVGGIHIECPGWCLLIVSTVTSRLFFWHSRGTQAES